ncbi:hypothetical protein B0A55_07468 [Friedmanniomyces simplex]|uniref:Uncharacterized protein n=2 Tax=Friedmanniomyces simplex TaxID=329884 RepID=A0A4U0WX68_9PEZI|nr:hypothetical protein B0A55_07468 [Friedmanniomyces simplex]
MSYARVRALRGLPSALRSSSSAARATPRVSAPARTQLAVGRRYASSEEGGAHGHGEASSDIPWMAGAVAVTIPACWYLWPTSHADSGHHDAHGEHEEHGEEEGGVLGGEDNSDGDSVVPKPVAEALPEGAEKAVPDAVHNTSGDSEEKEGSADEAPKEDDAPSGNDIDENSNAAKGDAAARSSTEQKQTANASDKASGSQGEGQDAGSVTPSDEAEPKEGGSNSGVGKGKMRSDSAGAGGETRKREPDNKGGFKKRIDSGLQKDLGGTSKQFDEDGSETAASSKPPVKGDSGQISSKQFGMSNSPTRHSTQIDQDPEKSKKSEGGPDTAKVMGTVDPNRPAT